MQIWQDGDCDFAPSDFYRFSRCAEHVIGEELPTYEGIVVTQNEIAQEEVSEDSDESILSCIDDEPYTLVASL